MPTPHTSSLRSPTPLRLLAAGLTLSTALVLTACAPEPTQPIAGNGGKETLEQQGGKNGGSESSGGESWGNQPEALPKPVTTLPASYPAEALPLPEGAVIADAGERTPTTWFVVVRVTDEAAASSLIEDFLATSGLTITADEAPEPGQRIATLSSEQFVVELLQDRESAAESATDSLTDTDTAPGFFLNLEIEQLY